MDHEFTGIVDTFNEIGSKGFRIFASLFFIVLLVIIAVMASLLRLKLFLQANFANQEIVTDVLYDFLINVFPIIFTCTILLWVFFIVGGCFLFIKTASALKLKQGEIKIKRG